ncbi:nucleotidyltransferase family protein [Fontivita pretiosa]|uniref:nucleotidyltransferase family protein n=1 Tax=Fontivita pretiosa TaxID=2989684 RepID=UPI003D16FB02
MEVIGTTDELRVELPFEAIAEVCRRLGVSELAVFGSALRNDFGPDSDVDFLVRFRNDDPGPWLEKYAQLQQALESLIGRKVDVVGWRAIEQSRNPYRRDHILRTARIIYAEG